MSAVPVTAIAAIGTANAPTASAYSTVHKFGAYERLYDAGGAVVTAWTVRDLEPSRDTVPDYPLAGKLWQAKATVQAVRGTVTPIIPDLNARANNGQNYQVLWQAFTPSGISGATIARGTKSAARSTSTSPAKHPPGSYHDGVQDLIWER